MINIYFVQHAKALTKDLDEKRPLSDLGITETKRIAQTLKSHAIIIDKIFHSGKLRAAQTAQLFSKTFDVTTVSALNGMNPNDNVSDFLGQITENSVMYIGHLPHIQKVVSALLTGDENCNVVQFQNSSVACLEIDKTLSSLKCSSLKWFISPNLC